MLRPPHAASPEQRQRGEHAADHRSGLTRVGVWSTKSNTSLMMASRTSGWWRRQVPGGLRMLLIRCAASSGKARRTSVVEVALRSVEDSDLDALFDQMRDPKSVQMAAF